MSVTPGEEQQGEAQGSGFCNVTWQMYQTGPDGVESVEGQLPNDWVYDIVTFGFSDDMVDYTRLDGIVCFRRLNPPEGSQYAPVRFGKWEVATEFVLCGFIGNQILPFHTEELTQEVIAWFISKQGQWHGAYSEGQDGSTKDEAGAPSVGVSPWASQHRTRKAVH